MDNQFIIRRTDITDIEALSALRQKTFRETFVEDFSISFSKNDLDSYFRSSASPEIYAKKLNDPQRAVWVIEDKTNGELVAFTVVGACNIDEYSITLVRRTLSWTTDMAKCMVREF